MSEFDILKEISIKALKKTKKVLTNKYLFVFVSFLILSFWVMDNTYIDRYNNNVEIKNLNTQIASYKEQIDVCKKKMNELHSSRDLERFAREEYYMKRKNEEVFIIEDED